MPSTYTASGGYELQATGENNNTWGIKLNTGLTLLDERIDGVASNTVTGDWTLTISNAVSSPGRKHVQLMVGTPAADFTVTLPGRPLNRIFVNRTGKTATISHGSGTTATVRNGQSTTIWTDGADVSAIDPTLDTIKGPAASLSLNSQKIINLLAGTANTDAVNKGQMDTAITSAIASAVVNVPVQTGNAGKYLKTDGTTPSWDDIDLGTSDVAGTLPVNKGGTGRATLAAGSVLVGDGTNNIVLVAPGTAGQALLSNGPGVAPAFATFASAGKVFISRQSLSSVASCDFTSGITSTYDIYEFEFANVKPASNALPYIRTSTNGGSSYDAGASNYSWFHLYGNSNGSTVTGGNSSGATEISLGSNNVGAGANQTGLNGTVRLYMPSAAQYAQLSFNLQYIDNNGYATSVVGGGARLAAADVDALRFLFSTGNIASGSVTLFGVRKT